MNVYINGEISMSLIKGDHKYYFSIEYDVENREFKIEVIDWTKGVENKCKQLEFSLKGKEDEEWKKQAGNEEIILR